MNFHAFIQYMFLISAVPGIGMVLLMIWLSFDAAQPHLNRLRQANASKGMILREAIFSLRHFALGFVFVLVAWFGFLSLTS